MSIVSYRQLLEPARIKPVSKSRLTKNIANIRIWPIVVGVVYHVSIVVVDVEVYLTQI